MNILAGVKHWTLLQYLGAAVIVSLPILIICVLTGFRPPVIWWMALGGNIVLAASAVLFIEWPNDNGFRETD